ncbi:MAG: hypothetical protein QS721_12065 [Candidatus Endonucleobacter sp. (ex Gigantidas childressi)]|nr:hypothetical protein [Candidatus Endonucleobacter sp. (ex Gigantidas childressi)]
MFNKTVIITTLLFGMAIDAHAVITHNGTDSNKSAAFASAPTTSLQCDSKMLNDEGFTPPATITTDGFGVNAAACLNEGSSYTSLKNQKTGLDFNTGNNTASEQDAIIQQKHTDSLYSENSPTSNQYYSGGLLGCRPVISILLDRQLIREITQKIILIELANSGNELIITGNRLDTHPDKEKIMEWYECSAQDENSSELDLPSLENVLKQSTNIRFKKGMELSNLFKKNNPCYNMGDMEYGFLKSFMFNCYQHSICLKDNTMLDTIHSAMRYDRENRRNMQTCFMEELSRIATMDKQNSWSIRSLNTNIINHMLCAGYIYSIWMNNETQYLTFLHNFSNKYYQWFNAIDLKKLTESKTNNLLVDDDIERINCMVRITECIFSTTKNKNKRGVMQARSSEQVLRRFLHSFAEVDSNSIDFVTTVLDYPLIVKSSDLLGHIKSMDDGLYYIQKDEQIIVISKNKEYCRLFSSIYDELSVTLPIPSSYLLAAHLIRNGLRFMASGSESNMYEEMIAEKVCPTPLMRENDEEAVYFFANVTSALYVKSTCLDGIIKTSPKIAQENK